MTFIAPIWLLGLLPWAAAVVALLTSRRPPTGVPFLDLWRLNAPREAVRRRYAAPPAAVVLGLLAALAAVLAAAGPAHRSPGAGGLVVVVDAGTSMSARGSADLRFREAVAGLTSVLRDAGRANLPIEWVVVPGPREGAAADTGRRIVAADLAAAAATEPATALNTRDALDHQIRARLADASTWVVAVTDQPLAVASDRLAQITPAGAAPNVGIRRLVVRRSPAPQAMVRIGRSGLAARPVDVRVTIGGRSVERRVEPPPAGGTRDLFVDLPPVGGGGADSGPAAVGVVVAELVSHADGFPGDDRAYAAAEADWPTVEPAAPVGELQRLIDVYAAARPAGDRSVRVRLVPAASPSATAGTEVVLPALAGPSAVVRPGRVADHPITRAVDDWAALAVPAATDRRLPDGPWEVVLSDAAGNPLVAVRESGDEAGVMAPARHVWAAIAPGGWADRIEYVGFWSAVFDWAGRADDGVDGGNGGRGTGAMAGAPLGELSPDWRAIELAPGPAAAAFWPGLYERAGDGRRQAFGPAEPVDAGVVASPAEQADRVRRLIRQGDRTTSWSPWLLVAALVLAAAAVGTWPRGRPT